MHTLLPIAIALLLAAGCTATSSSEREAMHSSPPPMPAPATFQISGAVTLHLTPQLVAETGLPETMKGSLSADARSEAVSAEPLRSRHEGHMTLTLTDGEGKRSIADVDVHVSGESNGSPSQGLGDAVTRFLDAASMMTRPIPAGTGK